MDTPALWLCIGCTALGLFFSINNYTLHHLVSSQLAAILRDRRRKKSGQWAVRDTQGLFLTTSCVRFASIVGTVLCIVYMVLRAELMQNGTDMVGWKLLLILAISVPIVGLFYIGLPVAWSRHGGEAVLARSLGILRVFYVGLWPVVRLLRSLDRMVKIFHRQEPEEVVKELEQDIMSAVDEGAKGGLLGRDERRMIKSVIDVHDTQASHIMTPRTEVIAVEDKASLKEVVQTITKEGHSRIPVYEDTLDNIVGILYAKDLLIHLANGEDDLNLREIMRPAIFVPETKLILDLLKELKDRKVHIVVVLDEYGGTSGLVTIEDILEEIVGEIVDEYEQPEPEPMVVLDECSVEVDAKVRIEELADHFEIEMENNKDVDTVGGLVFSLLGYMPKKGQVIEHEQLRFTVLDAEERKVNRLKVELLPASEDQEKETPKYA